VCVFTVSLKLLTRGSSSTRAAGARFHLQKQEEVKFTSRGSLVGAGVCAGAAAAAGLQRGLELGDVGQQPGAYTRSLLSSTRAHLIRQGAPVGAV
jgi:hypothetical protein